MADYTLTDDASRELAVRALVADRPAAVTELLDHIITQYNVTWRPLGDTENNHGTVELQADSPTACLVELIYNEFDAELQKAFAQKAPAGASYDDFPTVKEAVKKLDTDADVELLIDGSQTQKGDDIWSPIIRGRGKGQRKEDAFETFLGLNAPGKAKKNIPFVQGQFGMGATGVLKHCGNEFKGIPAYKFIASASIDAPGEWWWTIIRFNDDDGQYEHFLIDGELPVFTGEFGGELMDSFLETYEPAASNFTQFNSQLYGSFVKVYDYAMDTARGQVSASEGFVRKIERYLVEPPFPLRITELRYPKMKAPQTTTEGFLAELNKSEMQPNIIERESFPHEFSDERLGTRTIDVALFHQEEQNSQKSHQKSRVMQRVSKGTGIHEKHAVMFTVNGQTHGDLGLGFLENQCGFSKIATDVVVIVRFDAFPHTRLSKIFNPSRERLANSPLADLLKEELKEVLMELDFLIEEEDRRRARRSGDDADLDEESYRDLFEVNPDFARDLNAGTVEGLPGTAKRTDSTTKVTKDTGDIPFNEEGDSSGGPPRIPTYFQPLAGYDPTDGEHVAYEGEAPITVELPVNQRRKVRFITDAPHNYLTRDQLPGSLAVEPDVLHNPETREGVWTVMLEPWEAIDPAVGERHPVTVTLSRPPVSESDLTDIEDVNAVDELYGLPDGRMPVEAEGAVERAPDDDSPIVCKLTVEYTPAVTASTPGSPDTTPPSTETGSEGDEVEGSDTELQVQLPEIHQVFREHWDADLDDEKFDATIASDFDEHTLVSVDASRDETISDLDVTVNMDANALRSFISRQNVKDYWKQDVEHRFLRAIVFAAIALFQRHKRRETDEGRDDDEMGHADYIQQVINDHEAVFMLNLYGEEELDRITE